MSDVQYKLDYDDGAARQVGTEVVHAAAPRVESKRRKRKFRIPAAANTAITVGHLEQCGFRLALAA